MAHVSEDRTLGGAERHGYPWPVYELDSTSKVRYELDPDAAVYELEGNNLPLIHEVDRFRIHEVDGSTEVQGLLAGVKYLDTLIR